MEKNWHNWKIETVQKKLKTGVRGLTEREAQKRLELHGKNVLPQKKRFSRLKIFLDQFTNSLTYIMLAATGISFALGHFSDAVFILIVLLINTLVGYYQENKVNNSLEALNEAVRLEARVIRGGKERKLDSEELVPGDLVILKAGDKVPADGRIVEFDDLKINEASLTGEWLAVSKGSRKVAEEAVVAERKNMAFMGTVVERGQAKIIVTETSLSTQFGEIVALVKDTVEPKTPLQKKIARLSQWLALFVVLAIGVIVAEGFLMGRDLAEVFIVALALAVSAIPEGLLPATTVVLVLAMRRILKNKGVVKKLTAAESLGSVTTVCTDKTGTLTEGKMRVSQVIAGKSLVSQERVIASFKNYKNSKQKNTGSGQWNEGEKEALMIGGLTNDAFVENPEKDYSKWKVHGDFTDKALLLGAVESGLKLKRLEKQNPLVKKFPFNSQVRLAASLRENPNKKQQELLVVGAPEEVMSRCQAVDWQTGKKDSLDNKLRNRLAEKLEDLTTQGLRVVACAQRKVSPQTKVTDIDQLAQELTLVGFIGLKDPVRKEVVDSMRKIKEAGINPIIITGDHRLTAKAVAQELGFELQDDQILEGYQLAKLSDKQLEKHCRKVLLYSRALPEQKLRIVEALHKNNQIVAMFGDGINDAPALKAADIGIAVGSGTDVAKEVADLVLLDDNFATATRAIEQGRVAFSNIRKIFIFLVTDTFTEVVLFIGAMALGLPLPLLAAQILWINLVNDGFPGIALTTEQETRGVMQEPPRAPQEPIINKPIRRWIIAIFIINGIVTFGFFWLLIKLGWPIERLRTAVFVLTALDSLLFAYSVRSLKRPIFRKDIFSNRYLNWSIIAGFLMLVAAVYLPSLQSFLGTVALSGWAWLAIFVITFGELVMYEIFRQVFMDKKN